MPGMNSGMNVNNPTVVAAFRAALLHQGLIALMIFAVLGVAWVGVRAWRRAAADRPAAIIPAEPAGRQLLRIGFGGLWLFDGILQAQPKMAIGLPSQVIESAAAPSSRWVQEVVNWAGTAWSYHPMQAGAAAVWIQVGIGIWLLAAPRGAPSRLAGLVSVGWGLVVWAFGESFGGIFAPGLTWLFGAPGAVLIYVVAGVLIALPERAWHTRRLDAPVADVPDALAAAPGSSQLLALLTDGTAETSGPGATWTPVVTRRSLASPAAGTRCGLQLLTAAAFGSTSVMLLAGACAHPGIAGIFADTGGAWRSTGPVLPAVLARQPVTVLRLTRTGSGLVALLPAGTGPAASLLAAWSADSGRHWDLSTTSGSAARQ
jgi:hypothetical protein